MQLISIQIQKKATGVKVFDTQNKKSYEFQSKLFFLCASAVASASILLHSQSN